METVSVDWNSTKKLTKFCSATCVKAGKNTLDRVGDKSVGKTRTWEECQAKCSIDDACNHWTWWSEDAGEWAYFCATMSGYGSLTDDSTTVTGSKTCTGWFL